MARNTRAAVNLITYHNPIDGQRINVKRYTDKAVLVEISDNRFEWFPLSQVRFYDVPSGAIVVMPVWMVKQKGLSVLTMWTDESDIQEAIADGRASELYIFKDDGSLSPHCISIR